MRFMDLESVRDAVVENDDVLTVTMENLRNASGKQRLGTNVIDRISADLRKLGLAHWPGQLPQYQEKLVRLYVLDSEVGEIIQAIRRPGPSGDKLIRQVITSAKTGILQKVRELVCSDD